MTLKPFADESASLGIGGLTVENRLDRLALYGSLDITKDKTGLEHARSLRALLDAAVKALEAADLPAKVETGGANETVRNPFG